MRRRRRRRATWTVAATAAALAFGALVWETVAGPALPIRWTGYAALALTGVGAGAYAVLRWLQPAPPARTVAERLERLYPQARGRARESLADGGAGLAAGRTDRARAWLARKGGERLDAALASGHARAVARLRRVTAATAIVALVLAVVEPGAARRAVSTVVDPTGLWRGVGAWRVEPGDTTVRAGDDVEGRASFRGPDAGAPLVLEWRTPEGAWRADTVADGPAGRWRWTSLDAPRRYRLRYGPYASPEYAIEVDAPLALADVEARRAGRTWGPWSGFGARAGDAIEVRGTASEPIATAELRRSDGERIALSVEGASFAGAGSVVAGPTTVVARTADGRVAESASIDVAEPGVAMVSLLRPTDDPVSLEASRVWLEVRAASPEGVRVVRWERDDGRGDRLATAAGARDTTVTGIAGVGDGVEPGDTVRFRVVAIPVAGRPAVGAWRRAVVPSAAELRADARRQRERASRAVERAVSEARRVAEETLAGATEGAAGSDPAEAADRGLRAAADSLGAALERSLADPDLPPEIRERLQAYRELLADLDDVDLGTPRPGSVPDPTVEASTRADLLEELSERIAEIEARVERAAAADSLERLADAERALSEQTRAAEPEDLAAMGERQEAVEREARDALERARDPAEGESESGRRAGEALERAGEAIDAGDPAEAAVAQEEAAGALSAAASETREAMARDAEMAARRGAAVQRAGAEALFLAERQRDVVARETGEAVGGAGRADRRARQGVVTRGLERTLGALVQAIGGRPAGGRLPELLARAVFETKRAERLVERSAGGPVSGTRGAIGGPRAVDEAAEDAADALARLARALLRPSENDASAGGAGAAGASGAVAEGLERLARAQAAVADAAGATGAESDGGNPEAAAAQRNVARGVGEIADEAEEAGLDRRAMDALAREAEEAAARLERGLSGARTETELRSLSRRLADLGRTIERESTERRRSESARAFVPADPAPLTSRTTAPRLDPGAAMAGWESILPRGAVDPGRRYLERLADDGVREPTGAP